ncbi:MAG: RNA polymerase sigma factor [Candidatus Eiseniibacteriota bacterium]
MAVSDRPNQPLPVEPGPSTRSLVLGAQAGSREALEDLYRRYLPRLRRWARGRLPHRGRGAADTEDLVQDVLMRTLHRLPDLRPEGGGFFQSYTRQALLHAIANQVRNAKERAPSAALAAEAAPGPSPLEALIGREAMERYERGLARLDPEERELVACRLELRLSWEEIARERELPSADAARMATKRAVARLAREMSVGNA